MTPITFDFSWIIPIVSIIAGALAGWGTAAIKIGRYAQRVDDLKEQIRKHEQEIKTMSMKIVEWSTKVEERTKSYASTLTKTESPVTLNERGNDLLRRSGADAFVLQNQTELVEKIRKENPQTAYDVQIISRKIVESLKDEERFNQFKNFVYNQGIELEPIFIVMSLYLRDIALPLLGFRPEDIDKSDPSKEEKKS